MKERICVTGLGYIGLPTASLLVQRRIQMIHEPLHQVIGFASIFPNTADRYVWIDALATKGCSILGVDVSAKVIDLSDDHANKHTLVLGTIGSGKTVSVLNIVESGINRQLPVVYIDGKGDYDLACQVMAYARARGRPVYLFAMNGESIIYNPLASGGYSAKKDRIIELREWPKDHYRKLSEGYIQMVFKVLDACDIEIDLVSVADSMSFERLTRLIKQHAKNILDPERLLADIDKRRPAEKEVESLREEVWTLAESEIGDLFDTKEVQKRP